MDNPEILATFWSTKTQDEDKQSTQTQQSTTTQQSTEN
jgi:hypothetical protein